MTTDLRRASGGLGRGLAALIADAGAPAGPIRVRLDRIVRNPYQPRVRFDEDALERLSRSVAEYGVLQPVLVSELGDGRYQLVAGERRVRAAEMAGLPEVPVVVRSADEREQLALALVENVQRTDLSAIEEARAYRQLMTEFGLTQEEVAARVGRSRPTVANTLRLLDLAGPVQEAVESGVISEGHARAIAGLSHTDEQERLAALVEARGLSVRQTEELVRRARAGAATRAGTGSSPRGIPARADLERLEGGLREALGTKVAVARGRKGGRITIEYYDDDDLARLYERLTGGSL